MYSIPVLRTEESQRIPQVVKSISIRTEYFSAYTMQKDESISRTEIQNIAQAPRKPAYNMVPRRTAWSVWGGSGVYFGPEHPKKGYLTTADHQPIKPDSRHSSSSGGNENDK